MTGALLLVVTWLSAWAAARAVLRAAAPAQASLPASLVVAAALLAVVPGQVCRAVGDLAASMAIAAAAFLVVAGALSWRAKRADGARPAAGGELAWPAWPAWLVGAVGLGCVAHGAVTRNFFDEEHHVPMAAVIARGVVPPEHPLLPGQVIPYHWGVDALYAQLMVAGLRPDRAIDVVTIASFALLLLAAALVGAALAGRAGATLAVILAPLAGSPLAQPLHDGMGIFDVDRGLLPAAWAEWFRRPPPLTADFFQHPQGLAFPLVLVVLVLFCAAPSTRGARAMGAALLALLSLVQAVHFLVVGFGLGVATVVSAARQRQGRATAWRSAAVDLGLLALALALAVLFGGFFSPGAGTSSTLVWGKDFFADPSWSSRLVHHAAVFGLPLLLLPVAGAWAVRASHKLGLALVAGGAVGFFLPNVVVYASSWDIVKLYSAGGFLAGVALAGTFARWLTRPLAPRTTAGAYTPDEGTASAPAPGPAPVDEHQPGWRRWAVLATVVALTALTIEFPLVWLATRTLLQGQLEVPRKHDFRPRDDLLAVGRAVGPLIGPRENVLVGHFDIGRMTGLMTPGFDARRGASGHILDFARVKERMRLRELAMRTLHPEALRALEIRWILLSDGEVARLPPAARAAFDRLEHVEAGLVGFTLARAPR